MNNNSNIKNHWNKSYNHITFDKFRKGSSAPPGYKFVVNNMNYSNTTFPCIYLVKKQQKGLQCIAPWGSTKNQIPAPAPAPQLSITDTLTEWYNNINNDNINDGSSGFYMHQFNLKNYDITKQKNTKCNCCNTTDNSYLNNILCSADATRAPQQTGVVMSWTYWRKDITNYNNIIKKLKSQVFQPPLDASFYYFIILDTEIIKDKLGNLINDSENINATPDIVLKSSLGKTSEAMFYGVPPPSVFSSYKPFVKFWYNSNAETDSANNTVGYNLNYINDQKSYTFDNFIKESNNSSINNEIITNSWVAGTKEISYDELYSPSCWTPQTIATYNKSKLYENGWNENDLNGLNEYKNVPIKCFGILSSNLYDSDNFNYADALKKLKKIKQKIKTDTDRDIPIVNFDTLNGVDLKITEVI